MNKMRPIHPGEQLRDELQELGISAHRFAMDLKVPYSRINDILRERRGITADTALRIARYLGGTAEFWLNLQNAYELRKTRLEVGKQINKDIRPSAL